MKRLALSLAVVLLLAGCASEEAAPPPPPSAPTPRLYVGSAGSAPAAPERRRAGTVLFSVRDADLASGVLPLFQEQVGVLVQWIGPPRKVSLRLTQPMPWEDALDLVCQFTKTHPTRDYQGRLVLKDGWGGTLGSGDMSELDPGARGPRRRPGRYGNPSGGTPAAPAASASPGSGSGGPPTGYGPAGSGEAQRIMDGLDGRVNAGR